VIAAPPLVSGFDTHPDSRPPSDREIAAHSRVRVIAGSIPALATPRLLCCLGPRSRSPTGRCDYHATGLQAPLATARPTTPSLRTVGRRRQGLGPCLFRQGLRVLCEARRPIQDLPYTGRACIGVGPIVIAWPIVTVTVWPIVTVWAVADSVFIMSVWRQTRTESGAEPMTRRRELTQVAGGYGLRPAAGHGARAGREPQAGRAVKGVKGVFE
jgi:hypothetical protein